MVKLSLKNKVALGELGAFRNGVNFSKDQMGSGLKLINVKDIFGDSPWIDFENLDLVDLGDKGKLSTHTVDHNDLFFVRSSVKRDGIGLVRLANSRRTDTIHCGFVIRFRLNNKETNALFLTYLLRSPGARQEIINLSGGSAIINISQSALASLTVDLLSLPTQRKIAAILSAYDDLIENNLRRIKILEEMAQNLYREWFTYPFRGTGMPSPKPSPSGRGASGEGSPRRLVDSPLGPIPEGWEVVKVTQAVDVNPPERVPKETFKPYVAMEGLSITSMLVTVTAMRKGNSGAKYRNGDTLFARITPCLENGKIGFVQFLSPESPVGIGSTEFIVLRSRTLCPEFVYCLAREEAFRGNAIKSMSGASGRQRVDAKCFEKYFIAHPDSETLEQFRDKARPIFQEIQVLAKKNNNLRRTRGLLLPKLISGQVDVENVELSIGG